MYESSTNGVRLILERRISIIFMLSAFDDIQQNSGGEIRTSYIIEQAKIKGCKSVLVFKPSIFFNQGVLRKHFRMVKLLLPFVYFIAGLKSVQVHKQRFDLIYCGTCYPNDTLGAYLLKLVTGTPVVCVSHDTPAQLEGYRFFRISEKQGRIVSLLSSAYGKLEILLIQKIDLAASISKFGRKYLEAITGTDKIIDSYNGIGKIWVDGTVEVESRKFDITYLGRIIARKNINNLLEVVLKLTDDFPFIKFLIISNTPDERMKEVYDYVAKNFISKNVTIIKDATEEEKFSLLKQSKISINISYDETFSISTLEAASCGNALVLSDLSTFHDIYGDNAVYVDLNDPENIYMSVKELLSNRKILQEFMEKALRTASNYLYSSVWDNELASFGRFLNGTKI